ncbi:MAG: HIT domain-containing protein [Leptospirillia bacterium]
MFQLDQRLIDECHVLGRFPLSLLLLMDDARYPWCILVPEREGATEINRLDVADRMQLAAESAHLAGRMSAEFGAYRVNVGALGHIVPQLHLHHVVRFEGDPAWPGPVWGHSPAVPYSDELRSEVAGRIVKSLGEGFKAGG